MNSPEIWKPVVGWEGLYEVSSHGRVRSLDRIVNTYGGKRSVKGAIKELLISKTGYLFVQLYKNNKGYTRYVHRLVAEAFLDNPQNLSQVNHKDEIKKNNTVYVNRDGSIDFDKSNLEWCTQQYNLHYGKRDEICRLIQLKKRNNKKESKPVACYSLDGELINRYPSLHEAERQTGVPQYRISRVCRGIESRTYNYCWKFI